MEVYKQVFEVVVYSDYPIDTRMALDDLHYEITLGDCVGNVECKDIEILHDAQQIRDELIAIGNDGTFFDEED